MLPLSVRNLTTVLVALGLAASVSLWLMAVPTLMSLSTYVAFTTLLMGLTAVTLNTSRNGQATAGVAQLLYDTEHPTLPSPRHERQRAAGHPW